MLGTMFSIQHGFEEKENESGMGLGRQCYQYVECVGQRREPIVEEEVEENEMFRQQVPYNTRKQ